MYIFVVDGVAIIICTNDEDLGHYIDDAMAYDKPFTAVEAETLVDRR